MAYDNVFAVGGMSCVSCVRNVEKGIGEIPGVTYVSVNLTSGKAYVVSDTDLEWDTIAGAVGNAGYEALKEIPTSETIEANFRLARRRVIVAWAVAIPATVLMIIHMAGITMPMLPVLEILAGLAVFCGPGRLIFRGAWNALKHFHANMDVLVSLGTIASLSTAFLALFDFPVRSFGAMAALLPAFHLGGRLLEESLRRQVGADLRSFTDSGGGMANVLHDGKIIPIPVETVSVGMRLRIRSGERIPLDGRIIEGRGAVSEAMINGEPLPVQKDCGDEVIGGTVLESGMMEIEVSKTGEDAFLARMINLVEQAQGVQIPLQALADKVAGIFVPLVFLFALLSFASWAVFYAQLSPLLQKVSMLLPWVPSDAGPWTTAVFAMVSMLVVACPCALGLATPMAVSIGSSLAARRGLLIKGGEALQTSGILDVLVFDKTGTLTEGHPKVVYSNLSDEHVKIACAIEMFSIHPLAKSIIAWATESGLQAPEGMNIENIEEIPGVGVRALVDKLPYSLGKLRQEAPDVDITGSRVDLFQAEQYLGCIVLSDPVRADAAKAVEALHRRGIRTLMATGDTSSTALDVARQVGIPEQDVFADLKPEDKLRIIQDCQAKGERSGMIGDGINDAAALKAADVGFSMVHGTDLSIEAGDVVITRGGLEQIVEALDLSALMIRKIRSNLIWAFGYNIVALPAAALGLIHPLMAEAAMSISSLGVVLNSLSIRRK